MEEPIEEVYFKWLCARVLTQPSTMYVDLFRLLHDTPFTWIIPGDRNREEDGCELRYYFMDETGLDASSEWFNRPCSVLEMLVAFARNAAFQTNISDQEWMATFLENLNLVRFRYLRRTDVPVVEEIINTFLWRTYDPSGVGGLFPMRSTMHDQRTVELWYQLSEYLADQGPI
jgi:hypothetical protein